MRKFIFIAIAILALSFIAVNICTAEPEVYRFSTISNTAGLDRFLRNPIFPGPVQVTGTGTFTGDLTIGDDLTVTDDASVTGILSVTETSTLTGAVTATAGVQSSSVAVTSEVEATQSPIVAGTAFATITSDTATKVVVLPVGVPGNVIRMTVLATGAELQTLATGSATINGVDCSGANEMAMAAASVYVLTCIASETWVAYGWGSDGAAQATIVPDTDS